MVELDWEEAFIYRAGQTVELKAQPGTFDQIAAYEMTMVPPIWLENDPKPRYAHELRIVSTESKSACATKLGIDREVEVPAFAST